MYTSNTETNLNGKICWALWFPSIYTRKITRIPQFDSFLHIVVIDGYFNSIIATIPLLQWKRLFLANLLTKTNNLEFSIRMNCFNPQIPESTLGLY
jgi:hypothetical protein